MAASRFIAASEEYQLEKARKGQKRKAFCSQAGVNEWMTNVALHWHECTPRFLVWFVTLDSGFTSLHAAFRAQAREANQVRGAKVLGNRQLLRMALKFQPWSLKWRGRTWGKWVRWGSWTELPRGAEACVQFKWLLQLDTEGVTKPKV